MSKTKKKNEHFEALTTHESHVHGEDNGCVTKCVYKKENKKWKCAFTGHNYRENGFNYQKNCDEVNWYNLPIHQEGSDARRRFDDIFTTAFKQAWRDPSKKANAWYMGDGPYGHINFVASGWWPWRNNAHHLIPVDDALSKVLDLSKRILLQQAKYNVNKGINIIILPTSARHAKLFQLLKHPCYHRTYSMEVRNRMIAIRDCLNEAADEDKAGHPQINEQTLGKFGEQLHALSGRLRKQIREAGIKSPGADLDELANLVVIR
ncbi:AHH domain-containing protein [Archangium primigenium]|uniref:AHH domain-containing protein n=1 Tax=[Archangium] primigenium TaxID=2792470 RepID=UPI00195E0BC6|nr:AHH domain-containing protein [Archangium primigenium]MBM7115812.1 AHH domain-containing protein [Archangium primigenium]